MMITNLKSEYDRLNHSKMRAQRDEQFEIERIRREFAQKIKAMEQRQDMIQNELRQKEQELKHIELRERETATTAVSPGQAAKERRLHPHL